MIECIRLYVIVIYSWCSRWNRVDRRVC